MTDATLWMAVRAAFLVRLAGEINANPNDRSIWAAEGMDRGDVSEFGDMMSNFENVLGVPEAERLDWPAAIRKMEG